MPPRKLPNKKAPLREGNAEARGKNRGEEPNLISPAGECQAVSPAIVAEPWAWSPGSWLQLDKGAAERAHEVGAVSFTVYVLLARHLDARRECFPSVLRLAEMSGYHRGTVLRALERLESAGWIVTKRICGRHNVYHLPPIVTGSACATPTSRNNVTGSACATPTSSASATPTSSASATLRNPIERTPLKKPHKGTGKPTKAKSSLKEALPPELDTDAFRVSWQAWREHRREIKKALTPSSTKMQLRMLAGLGAVVAIDAINESVRCGWTGLFPPTEGKNGKHKTTRGQRHPDDVCATPGSF